MKSQYVKNLCTVIITSFQREKYIIKTVNSVLRQTYRPIELIVIDDGSVDKTFELLKIWEKQISIEENFKTIILKQSNTGAPKARNRALELSTGEFIQEIGSDDLIHPLKLEVGINLLNKFQLASSCWSPLIRLEDKDEDSFLNKELRMECLIRNAKILSATTNVFVPEFMPSAALHRAQVFRNAGTWNTNLIRWQDLEYQVRMMNNIKSYVHLYEPLYFFRQHNEYRINNMFEEKEGIHTGLLSLKYTEFSLTKESRNNIGVNKTMYSFYLNLFLQCIKFNHSTLLPEIKGQLIKWARDFDKRIAIKFIYLIYLLGGRKLIIKILVKTKYI
jgi:glycosyltransferase involved in cell wall biosynthesis